MKAENEAHFRAQDEGGGAIAMTGTHKAILVVFGLAFGVMMYGVIPWEDLGVLSTLWWWFPEMTASFLLFAIIIGLIGRMKEGVLTSTFVDGARDQLPERACESGRDCVPERERAHEPLHPDLGGRDVGLAIARVPYGSYLRWVWPLLAMLAVVTIVVLTIGALIS